LGGCGALLDPGLELFSEHRLAQERPIGRGLGHSCQSASMLAKVLDMRPTWIGAGNIAAR
jgi:hypothetical protein